LSLVGSIQLLILAAHEWIREQPTVFHDMDRRLAVKTIRCTDLIYVVELRRNPLDF